MDLGVSHTHTHAINQRIEVTAASKNTTCIDLMRESCENVARQNQDKNK